MIGFYTPLAYNNYAPFMWQFNVVYNQTQTLIGDSLRNMSENGGPVGAYPSYGYSPFGCYAAPSSGGGGGYTSEVEEADVKNESAVETEEAQEAAGRDEIEETDDAESGGGVVNTHKTRSTKRTYATNPISTPKTSQVGDEGEAKALRNEFIDVANSYSNCSEANGTHHKFCINPTCKIDDPNDKEWCTDFVSYVVKEAYRKNGKSLPRGFVGFHDVETMKNWAINNDMFIRTSNQPRKAEYIAKNIKRGDIIVINEHNASHIGFVTGVDDDGVIHTIEGNREDRVKGFAYTPNYNKISGFIRMK